MTPDDSDIKSDDVLLDGDELASALDTLRADPDEFQANVMRRITAAANDDAPAAAPAQPKWLRRAAAIAPPGVVQAALATKTGVAKGSLLAAPWAVILLGLASVVGLFFATADLQGDRAAGLDREHAVKTLRQSARARLAWTVTLMIPFALLFAAIFLRSAGLIVVGFAFGAVVCVAVVRALSRSGLADRRQVGSIVTVALSWSMAIGGPVTFGQLQFGLLTAFVSWPILALAMGLALRLSGEKKGQVAAFIVVPLFLGLSGALFLATDTTLDGMSRREIAAWLERFDDPATEIGEWAEFGLAREALGAKTFDALDLTPARRALAAYDVSVEGTKGIHPVTAYGAWRAGIASEELIAAHLPSKYSRQAAAAGDLLIVIAENNLLGMLAWRQNGTLDAELRAGLIRSLDKNLPDPTRTSALELARNLLDAADLIGDKEFVARNRARLHGILSNTWSRNGNWYQAPGGFGSRLSSGQIHVNAKDTMHAVHLMTRAGVPDSIELHRVDEYLTTQVQRGSITDPHPYFLQANYARMNLRRDFDVSPPGSAFVRFLWKNMVFVTVVLFAVLCVWLVYRAPRLVSIDDGPLADLTASDRDSVTDSRST